MAPIPVTRASLTTRFLQRANTSGYIEPTIEAPGLIDTSMAKFYNWMVGIFEDYFTKKNTPYNIIGGQDTYPLPTDFMKARELWFVDTNGTKYPLIRMNISDLTGTPVNQSSQQPVSGYVIAAQGLILYPKPSQTLTQTIHMWYIPEYSPPANDSSPVFPALAFGWDEWVILDATIAARLKSMMPANDLMAERAQLEQKIMHQLKNRDAGAPPRVRNTGWNSLNNGGWSQFAKY